MNICFIETQEQVSKIDKDILRSTLPIALTPFAMDALDRLGLSYRIITDYVNIEELEAMLYETVENCISFCQEIDKIIRAKFQDSIFENSGFEPCFWMNKHIVTLFLLTLRYTHIFRRTIEYEKPSRIYYFTPNDWNLEPEKIFFSNTNFIAYHLENIKSNYSEIEWISFCSGNEFLIPGFATLENRSKLKNKLARILPKTIKARWQSLKMWQKLPRSWRIDKNSKKTLILGILKEIIEIMRNSNGRKQVWLWTDSDKINTTPVSCSLIPKRANLNVETSLPQLLVSENEFKGVVKEVFPEFYKDIISLVLRKYPIIHKCIFEAIQIYIKATNFFLIHKINVVIAKNGADYVNNAVLAAGKYTRVKSCIVQHGGTYGLGHVWQPEVQDYYFSDYFALWGKDSKRLVEKYEKHNCSFFYIGRLKRKPRSVIEENGYKKRILFVPNNSYKGYLLYSHSDCWIFDLEKKVIDIFKKYSQYDYFLKPTPKHRIRDVLREYWLENLPNARIIDNKELSDVCNSVDLVIQDHLGTTLLDAFRVKSKVIGLRRKSFGTFYPEVERQLRKSCIFCQSQKEFLEMIDKYLSDFDELPDFSREIETFNKLYCGHEIGEVIYKNFEKCLTG